MVKEVLDVFWVVGVASAHPCGVEAYSING